MYADVHTCQIVEGNYQMCLCIHTSAHVHTHTYNPKVQMHSLSTSSLEALFLRLKLQNCKRNKLKYCVSGGVFFFVLAHLITSILIMASYLSEHGMGSDFQKDCHFHFAFNAVRNEEPCILSQMIT